MKKSVLLLLLLAVCPAVYAQLSIAPEAGLNFANIRAGVQTNLLKGGVIHTTMRTGFAVGVIANYQIKRFSVQPGVFYHANGCNVTGGGHVSVQTIQIPLNVQYGRTLGDGPNFFVGLGPYVAMNLGYKEKIGNGEIESYPVGNDTASAIKPVDVGVGINAGIIFHNLYFRLRGQMGVTNVQPQGDEHNFMRTSSLGVSAGYYILRVGKKPKK